MKIKHLPSILSISASIGVVGTAILSAKATPKALGSISEAGAATRKEKFIAAWKHYIPTVASGLFTIGCILTANGLNKNQQDKIMASYIALSRSYNAYRQKVIELHGFEEHREIEEEISAIKTNKDSVTVVSGFLESSCTDFMVDEEEHLFYDPVGGKYFTSTIGKVLQAEYHLNRKFCMDLVVTMNDFYEFLAMEEFPTEEEKGWCLGKDDIYWIDFDNYTAKVDDIECMIAEPVIYPTIGYLE